MAKRVVDIEPPKAVVANTMVANKRASDGHKDKDAARLYAPTWPSGELVGRMTEAKRLAHNSVKAQPSNNNKLWSWFALGQALGNQKPHFRACPMATTLPAGGLTMRSMRAASGLEGAPFLLEVPMAIVDGPNARKLVTEALLGDV